MEFCSQCEMIPTRAHARRTVRQNSLANYCTTRWQLKHISARNTAGYALDDAKQAAATAAQLDTSTAEAIPSCSPLQQQQHRCSCTRAGTCSLQTISECHATKCLCFFHHVQVPSPQDSQEVLLPPAFHSVHWLDALQAHAQCYAPAAAKPVCSNRT
jgi:hypothetical protein